MLNITDESKWQHEWRASLDYIAASLRIGHQVDGAIARKAGIPSWTIGDERSHLKAAVETHFAFDWDPKKAALNRRKHRISFEEARTVFSDPGHSESEERWHSAGYTSSGRIAK